MNCETFRYNAKFNSSTIIENTERELSKSTLKYYEENIESLRNFIVRHIRKQGFPECDADIILSNLYMSLLSSRDYGDDINDYNYTIASYVRVNATMCIKRYISGYTTELKFFDYNQVALDDDSEERVDKIDILRDTKQDYDLDYCIVDTDKSLKNLEYKRYVYGVDIYVLLMLGVVRMILGDRPSIDRVYSNLGIDKDNMTKAHNRIAYDEQFNDCLIGLTKDGISISCLNKLKNYIYFFDKIIDVLEIKLA